MTGFSVEFAYPWLLLLLIPAAVLTVLPYFFLNKRYRRTRNRIISMVMHGLVMLFAILALSGMTFEYTLRNDENEILLLVDVSDTEEASADRRDAFVEEVVNESAYRGFQVGIVTFGFDQELVAEFSTDGDGVMNKYYASLGSAVGPDRTATDIAAALRYAQTLFRYPESAKIILVSDGKQTDENARSVARSIAAQGIRVDTVHISDDIEADAVRVMDITFPAYHVGLNEAFSFEVQLMSDEGSRVATLEIRDSVNNETVETTSSEVELIGGAQNVSFQKSFSVNGVHEISVSATLNGDSCEENNTYCTYFNVEVFTNVLVLEHVDGQSERLREILENGGDGISYDVEVRNIMNAPTTLGELCNYDQVILNNIANSDLPAGFDTVLYNYVYSAGGGLFTTGGLELDDSGGFVLDENGNPTAHAYNRMDLTDTLLQQMLPAQAIKYTPPVAVEIIIDVSGSMSGAKLNDAKNGAIDCLQALDDRDYIGIMTLDSTYGTILNLTPRTQESTIKEAIRSITSGGSTNFTDAISRAGIELKSQKNVDKRHMIIISDGEWNEGGDPTGVAKRLYEESGITISAIGVDMYGNGETNMKNLVLAANGGTEEERLQKLYRVENSAQFGSLMLDDLEAPEITETEMVEFHPIITNPLSNLAAGLEHENVNEDGEIGGNATQWKLPCTLDGFFGTRARAGSDTVLVGEYGVPIYAQWKFGNGMVGSFMCDVYGEWSSDFISDDNGVLFLRNVVGNLMPLDDIHSQEIKLNLREENYFNQLGISVSRELEEGETVDGEIELLSEGEGTAVSLSVPVEEPMEDVYVTSFLTAETNYSRCNFVVKTPGVYRITVRIRNAAGEAVAEAAVYKSFSYSAEYAEWTDTDGSEDPSLLLADLADRGGGKTVVEDDPWSVFDELIPEIHKTIDPRIALMIASIVCFLIDILVRKFKFKWPHELIREHKEKKAEQQ